MQATFDPSRLLARSFVPLRHAYGLADTQLYALALGLGADPTDAQQLRYVYEGEDGCGLQVLPTFANVLAYPGFWAREPDTGIAWQHLVHAEQDIVLHRPLSARGEVTGFNRVSGLWDRGAERGAFLEQTRTIRDASDGTALATVKQLSLLRRNGGFGAGDTQGAPPAAHALPRRAADRVCELTTLPQGALLYRLCGDRNPLHADPQVARAAGFERPILHGMATMGIVAHAAISALLGGDGACVSRVRVRFSAPAYPGEALSVELWRDGDTLSLRATARERGVVVINNGLMELA